MMVTGEYGERGHNCVLHMFTMEQRKASASHLCRKPTVAVGLQPPGGTRVAYVSSLSVIAQ